MPRANSICAVTGCLKVARKDGACKLHSRPAWQGSARNASRPGGWQATRRLALRRDRYLCRLCGSAGTEVDHITPVSLGGSWALDNAQTLCSPCHMVKTLSEASQARARRK